MLVCVTGPVYIGRSVFNVTGFITCIYRLQILIDSRTWRVQNVTVISHRHCMIYIAYEAFLHSFIYMRVFNKNSNLFFLLLLFTFNIFIHFYLLFTSWTFLNRAKLVHVFGTSVSVILVIFYWQDVVNSSNSVVILALNSQKYGQIADKGLMIYYGRYRSQLTLMKNLKQNSCSIS